MDRERPAAGTQHSAGSLLLLRQLRLPAPKAQWRGRWWSKEGGKEVVERVWQQAGVAVSHPASTWGARRSSLGAAVPAQHCCRDSRAGGRDTEGMPDGGLRALLPRTARGQGTRLFPTSQRCKARGAAGEAKLLVPGLLLRGAAHTGTGLCKE